MPMPQNNTQTLSERECSNPVGSFLGYSTGRCDFDGSELLIAMKCYFDGSEGTDPKGDTWLTLAGVAAPDKSWEYFDSTWNRMLRERYPIAPYIHMWQIISATDPFERVNGWSRNKVFELISDALEVIRTRENLLPFSCRVNLSARKRIMAEGRRVEDPPTLCARMVCAFSMQWQLDRKRLLEQVYLFFDRGEAFIKPLKDEWLAKRTPPWTLATDPGKRIWDLISNIQDADMELTPALQAADMVAWATSRDLANKLEPIYDLNEYVREIKIEHKAVIDEALLRKLYVVS